MMSGSRALLHHFLVFIALAALSACARHHANPPSAAAQAAQTPSVEWNIVIAKDLKIDERVCWRGFSPDAVEPEMPSGLPFAKVKSRSTEPGGKGGCIDLAIDLDAMARSLADETAVMRIGGEDRAAAIYGSFDPWLWRPRPWPKGMLGRLFIKKPPEISVSLPHLPIPDEAAGGYIVPFSTWSFMARFAIGHFTIDERDIAGSHLSIVTLPGARPTRDTHRFIDGAASAVATIGDPPRMPIPRVQILLRAGGGGGRREADPVQFGMAMRGAGASVALRVSPTATEEQLYGEWIATHELSHLWLPPVDREGAWLSEGLASYYQCILRSRVAMYEEARGWDELVSGFERGRAQAGEQPLKDARRPRFQHIYWGGAAIAFKLDVMLRQHGSSLDIAVASVRRSMDDSEDRPAEEMIRLLSRLSNAERLDLVTPVRAWLDQPFPDTSRELHDLGVEQRTKGGIVTLNNDAPQANLRKAIAAKR